MWFDLIHIEWLMIYKLVCGLFSENLCGGVDEDEINVHAVKVKKNICECFHWLRQKQILRSFEVLLHLMRNKYEKGEGSIKKASMEI